MPGTPEQWTQQGTASEDSHKEVAELIRRVVEAEAERVEEAEGR